MFTGCGSVIGENLPQPKIGFKWVETSPQIVDVYECQCGQGGCYQAHQEFEEIEKPFNLEAHYKALDSVNQFGGSYEEAYNAFN